MSQWRVGRAVGGIAWLLLLVAAGCGKGTVAANGHVLIEGKPASAGRLSLIPLERQPRAVSLVAEDGAFALRSNGAPGAVPGSYRVSFKQSVDDKTMASLPRELAADELCVFYQGPRESPLVIPESGAEDLVIDIRQDSGWSRSLAE